MKIVVSKVSKKNEGCKKDGKDNNCKDNNCKDNNGMCLKKTLVESNDKLTKEETERLVRKYASFPLTTYLANIVGIDPLIIGCFIVNRKVTPEGIELLIDFFELLTGRTVIDDYGIVPTNMH